MKVMVLLEKNLFHVQSQQHNISLCGKRISVEDKFILDISAVRKHGNKVCKQCYRKAKKENGKL